MKPHILLVITGAIILCGCSQREKGTAGYTYGSNGLSTVNVSIRVDNNNFSITNNNTFTTWVAPYVLSIQGTFTILYKQVQHIFSINGDFTIPEEYHQTT